MSLVSLFRRHRFRDAVIEWGSENNRDFPWRETSDPYAVLVSELLLQRTRGEHVVATYLEFIRRWPDPRSLTKATIDELRGVLSPLGLTGRARQIRLFAKALQDQYGGVVPRDETEAEKLPQIGPYSSRAVQVFSRDADLPLVDWVIARVLRRYFGLDSGKRPNADGRLWQLAEELARLGSARSLWYGVLDLGAQVCVRNPRCELCPLKNGCNFASAASRNQAVGAAS